MYSIKDNEGKITANERIEKALRHELEAKYKRVESEAGKAISSFASLVNELIKLKEVSTGTQAKEKITKLTCELNNTSVFFAKMITEELSMLHKVINPGEDISKEATEAAA